MHQILSVTPQPQPAEVVAAALLAMTRGCFELVVRLVLAIQLLHFVVQLEHYVVAVFVAVVVVGAGHCWHFEELLEELLALVLDCCYYYYLIVG